MTIKPIECARCGLTMPITQFIEHVQSRCQKHGKNTRTEKSTPEGEEKS